MERNTTVIDDTLRKLGRSYFQISEFRITHGYLHLLVTNSSFKRLIDIYLGDCFYLCGPTSGGPWEATLRERVVGGKRDLVLSIGDGTMVMHALRAKCWIENIPDRES